MIVLGLHGQFAWPTEIAVFDTAVNRTIICVLLFGHADRADRFMPSRVTAVLFCFLSQNNGTRLSHDWSIVN